MATQGYVTNVKLSIVGALILAAALAAEAAPCEAQSMAELAANVCAAEIKITRTVIEARNQGASKADVLGALGVGNGDLNAIVASVYDWPVATIDAVNAQAIYKLVADACVRKFGYGPVPAAGNTLEDSGDTMK